MANTITFPTLRALTAHAAEAYKGYPGPWPKWADNESKRASVFAKRAAFGLSDVPRFEVEDTVAAMLVLDSMGEKLHAAAIAHAEANADQAIIWQTGPDYVTIDEHRTAMQNAGLWPADADDERWHFAAIFELIYAALTQK